MANKPEKSNKPDLSTPEKREQYWNSRALVRLKNKKIVEARYLTDAEMEQLGWDAKGIAIFFNDGSSMIVSQDDEMNGPGALHGSTMNGDQWVLPAIY